jgi:hypothetical protein
VRTGHNSPSCRDLRHLPKWCICIHPVCSTNGSWHLASLWFIKECVRDLEYVSFYS